MAEGVSQFGNISLGTRGGASVGQLKVSSSGFVWRKSGGGKGIEIQKKDLETLSWAKGSRGCQLVVTRKNGPEVLLQGFREKDLDTLKAVSAELNKNIKEEPFAVSGRNWGNCIIDGSSLVFRIDGKAAFRIPLPECGQVTPGKDEVMLEFPVDDTGGNEREDALVEMNFFVPKNNPTYRPPEPEEAGEDGAENGAAQEVPAAKVFYDRVMQHADVDTATGDTVVAFDQVAVLAPRGRFEVEMYMSFLKLVGQAQDYRLQYSHVVRIFVLPKSNTPHTLVVISMDPPIRKGNTYYPHILCQFGTEEDLSLELDISDEALAAKNEKCGGKLSKSLQGPAFEVFAKTLRGLSGAKLTKPGTFMNADGSGPSVRCSFKADDGFLYPLERAFFYVHKPPTLIVHDEIESCEFLRQGGGVLAASAKTFDLNFRLKNDQEILFRGIQKSEWTNLFNFIQAKRLRIENLREAELGPMGGGRAIDLGADIDKGIANMAAKGEMDDEDEEDSDFAAGSEDASDDDSEASGSGGSDVDEERPKKKEKAEKKRPAPAAAKKDKEARPPAPKKAKASPAEKPEKGARKPRKKKDPNAPKKGLSAYMFFVNEERDKIKSDNPGIAFGEVGKIAGERWKALTPEAKKKFEELAAKDKERYAAQMKVYAGGAGGGAAAGGDDDVGDESD